MDRTIQRARLLEQLGDVARPLREFLENGASPSAVPIIRAQFRKDVEIFDGYLRPFLEFQDEVRIVRTNMSHFIGNILDPLQGGGISQQSAQENLQLMMERARNAILALPVIPLAQVFEDGSPFQFYLWLRSVCASAARRLALLDPWASVDVFHRYLDAVPPVAQVSLVTKQSNAKNWPALLSVARLYAVEHPFELRDDPTLHSRYLLADDVAFSITASVKDAAGKASCEVKTAVDPKYVEGLIAAAAAVAL